MKVNLNNPIKRISECSLLKEEMKENILLNLLVKKHLKKYKKEHKQFALFQISNNNIYTKE